MLALLLAALAIGCSGGEIGETAGGGECTSENDFVCGDGSCVPLAEKCNGTENCSDGTDEDDCVTRCERTDYRCKDGNTCVTRDAVCDGRSDCPGGDDESTCASKECDGFECGDGTCIDPAAKCNGATDCPGGEDESAVTCAPVTCPNADDLRCTDGRTCVTKAQQCDGTRHCPRGEDEGVKMCADGSGDPDGDGKGSGGDDNKPHPGGGGGGGKPGGGGQDRPCGDVPEAGVCKDDQLVWCDHGRLERKNCRDDGKSCGQNADGNNACLDTDGEPEVDCGAMPAAGTCQGSTLMFCTESGEPRTEDCMAKGEQCVTDEAGARCAPAAGTCGDIDYQGRCNGQVVEWCNEAGERETYDCALSGQACAFLDAEVGYGCQAAPCGEITYYGECDGDTLRYCADDTTLIQIDCMAEYGVGCGLEDDVIGYNCGGGGGESSGGCGDVSYLGTCDGDVAVWCSEEEIAQYDCSVQGKTCGYVDDEVGYWCVSASGESACGDIDYAGTCDGDWAVWCENDTIQYADCTFDGGCGYVDDAAGYYCLGDSGGGGGSSEVTSCDGLCGVGEVEGSDPVCYCDDACVENGDCCGGSIEYDAVCGYYGGGGGGGGEEAGSCYDWCGYEEPAPGSSPACYCDDYCYQNGDCCADIDDYCY
jgi:hypothetical protein